MNEAGDGLLRFPCRLPKIEVASISRGIFCVSFSFVGPRDIAGKTYSALFALQVPFYFPPSLVCVSAWFMLTSCVGGSIMEAQRGDAVADSVTVHVSISYSCLAEVFPHRQCGGCKIFLRLLPLPPSFLSSPPPPPQRPFSRARSTL